MHNETEGKELAKPHYVSGSAVQWLSGRVVDSRPKGWGFEPQRRHCVVSLSKTHSSLFSTGSTQEDPSQHNLKIVDSRVVNLGTTTKLC